MGRLCRVGVRPREDDGKVPSDTRHNTDNTTPGVNLSFRIVFLQQSADLAKSAKGVALCAYRC